VATGAKKENKKAFVGGIHVDEGTDLEFIFIVNQ